MFPLLASIGLATASAGSAFALGRWLWLLHCQAAPGTWLVSDFKARLRRVLVDGVAQRRLHHDRWAGLAHQCIFFGFLLLLPRIIVLFGRAFSPSFGALAIDENRSLAAALHPLYHALRIAAALAVLFGTGVFAGLRFSAKKLRLQPTFAALWILATIATMMLADFIYDATGTLLAARVAVRCHAPLDAFCSTVAPFAAPFITGGDNPVALAAMDPVTPMLVALLRPFGDETLLTCGLASYALHLALVWLFLLALPYTKHFHLVTVWPNLFFDTLAPTGTLEPMARTEAELLLKVEAGMQTDDGAGAALRIGKGALRDFSAQERLGLFACTACGRCTEHCPVADAGGVLDPRQLTLNLRDALRKASLVDAEPSMSASLVPSLISSEALWSCTNCGACEERCPVGVRYITTIVDLRRHQLLMRGEAPMALQRLFDGSERQHNPWNLPRAERAQWAQGLDVPQLRDVEHVEYLYWVGCAASFDGRAQSVARALVKVMRRANVTFAILGVEERCTGDPARRAGNEPLFLQLAQQNIELLNRYQAEGRFERIITGCPHCLTTLGHDYAALGGRYSVLSHVAAIDQWVADGRIELLPPSDELLTVHDPCTLSRGAGITQAPRRLLARLAGSKLVEPENCGRLTACCGAGGAQWWLEQPSDRRINQRRANELSDTGAKRVISACPFCLTMLEDGMHHLGAERQLVVSDIAEIVDWRSRDA